MLSLAGRSKTGSNKTGNNAVVETEAVMVPGKGYAPDLAGENEHDRGQFHGQTDWKDRSKTEQDNRKFEILPEILPKLSTFMENWIRLRAERIN